MKPVDILILCLGLAITALIFTAQSDADIDPASVIGAWLFEEGKGDTVSDSSGNDLDGTVMEGCEWAEGKYGMAMDFDDKDEYVHIPASLLFSPEEFTVCFWMYPRTIGGNNPVGAGTSTLVVTNGNPGDGGGSNWWFELWNGGSFNFATCVGGCAGPSTPITTPNKWYFITGTHDGEQFQIYVDGVLKGSVAHIKGVANKGLILGDALCPTGHGCDGGYYDGLLDDVVLLNYILSVDEIKDLMDSGAAISLDLSQAVGSAGKLAVTWGSIKE